MLLLTATGKAMMATMDSERRGAVYQRRADTGVWWGERGITLLAF